MPTATELAGLPAFVDYGAELPIAAVEVDESDQLLVELQRSFDVWERTWRDLPLARLYVEFGDDDAGWTAQLGEVLALPVERLDPEALLPGFAAAAAEPGARLALLPLAGALLRRENRTL
jgi:MSHA biogenesis protein MshI